jgi:GTP-binding protein EngB required for normal cell division
VERPRQVDRKRLAGFHSSLVTLCEQYGIASLLAEPDTVASLMGNGPASLEVAILGRFKSGKSSMLNWLAGERILPVNALPATAIVTRLEHGDTNTAEIEFTNGQRAEVRVDQIADYITEQGNPQNEKGVRLAEVRTPGLADWPAVRFVDTPGTGSVYSHNTAVASAWVPHVAAAIVTTSAENPASEQDMQLLRETALRTPEITVVVTKADLLEQEDLQPVIQFVADACRSQLGRPVPVFPFSVKPHAVHLTRAFQGHLRRDFETNRPATVEEIIIHRLRWIAGPE